MKSAAETEPKTETTERMGESVNSPLDELCEYFRTLVSTEEHEAFFAKLKKYVLFAQETSPFNTIIRENDLVLPNAYLTRYPDVGVARSLVRGFHNSLVIKAEERDPKKVIILNSKEKSISLRSDGLRCYLVKGTNPQRFRIVMMLYRTQTGKTAREIADLLRKDEVEKSVLDNIKDEVVEINNRFKVDVKISEVLIAKSKSRGKNVYALNRARFSFQEEKL